MPENEFWWEAKNEVGFVPSAYVLVKEEQVRERGRE